MLKRKIRISCRKRKNAMAKCHGILSFLLASQWQKVLCFSYSALLTARSQLLQIPSFYKCF
jgi:hypothetical protein